MNSVVLSCLLSLAVALLYLLNSTFQSFVVVRVAIYQEMKKNG